jgi:hypothetical protein
MNEDAVDALNDILDALQDILEDPVFTVRDSAPRTVWDSVVALWRGRGRMHDDDVVIERLELIEEQRPGKLAALARAMEHASALQGLESQRSRNAWYKFATAPLIVPQVLGMLGLLTFSTREAQWVIYYGVWLGEAVFFASLANLISPLLVPGVIMWCVIAEMMEKDLEAEELLGSLFLFRMLSASSKMESILELCREKGVECGRLVAVSERWALTRASRRRHDQFGGAR